VGERRQIDRDGSPLIGSPKSEAGRRTITIPAAIIGDLRHHLATYAQPESEGYVVTGDKGGLATPHMLQTNWNRARRQVGIEHIHLHDLRHLAGTLPARAPEPRSSCTASAMPAPKPPFAISTPPENATSPSPTRSMD